MALPVIFTNLAQIKVGFYFDLMNLGGLAQLGEHLLCKQGVVGSIPSSSTTTLLHDNESANASQPESMVEIWV